MDDTAPNQSNSYVNTYVPPSDAGAPVSPAPSGQPTTPVTPAPPAPIPPISDPNSWLASTSAPAAVSSQSVAPTPMPSTPPPAPVTPPQPDSDMPAMPSRPTTLSESPQASEPAPTVAATPAAPVEPATPEASIPENSQSLEDQNIFDLLGVNQASDEEKEAFLDELQQVIWEDFIENDVQLLLTEAEMAELQKLQAQTYADDLEKQEAVVVYLEKLIPDLENIMLEKALELKRDMMMERVAGMKEYFAGQNDKLQNITRAEGLVADNQWRAAAEILNQTK